MTHIPVCGAYMSDLYPPEERAKAFGIMGATFGIGMVIGPSALGYALRANFYYGLIVGLGVVILAILLTSLAVEESIFVGKSHDEVVKFQNASKISAARYCNPFSTIGVIMNSRNLYLTGLSIVYILYCTGVADVLATLVVYTEYRYNWSVFQVGLCDSFLGIFICINQGLLLRLFEKYLGLRKMLVWGFMVSVCSHLFYAFSIKWWMFLAAMAVSSLGFTGHPAILTLITNAVDPSKRGMVLGAMGALQATCTLIGDVSYDNIFAYFTSKNAFIVFPGAQFVVGSFMFACSACISAILFVRYSKEDVALLAEQTKDDEATKPLLIND
jgi:DHA1 family tetracycline resistance protein-like MFS transporter